MFSPLKNVTDNPAEFYAWMQWAMAGCPPIDPHGDNGNNATAAEQTIEARNIFSKGPSPSRCLSEDNDFPQRPAFVENWGRGAQ